jgi:transposase, IS30 family
MGGSGMAHRVAYARLTVEERIKIEALWEAEHTLAEIAQVLGRHRSTIGREIARNGCYRFTSGLGVVNPRSLRMVSNRRGRYNHAYSARSAQRKAVARAPLRARTHRKLDPGPVREAVLDGLRKRWSPKQISRRLGLEHPGDARWSVSHETIYQALYLQSRGSLRRELAEQVALRSGRTRRRPRPQIAGPVRSRRPWTTGWNISERPAEAADRAVPGHWEGDLVIGARGQSAIITCVERSTRFTLLGALPHGRDSDSVVQVLSSLIGRLPTQLRRSLTWDNGVEMAKTLDFTVATDCRVYFADPHKPWQRGTNENTNGLLRQYFPKHTHDFTTTTQTDLDAVAAELNGRPRETLGFHTPAEKLGDLVALGT